MKGVDPRPRDLKLRILKREGTRFEGEYWNENSKAGLTIAGNVDPMGNITWRETAVLIKRDLDKENKFALVGGVVTGKLIRVHAKFATGLIADVKVTLDE